MQRRLFLNFFSLTLFLVLLSDSSLAKPTVLGYVHFPPYESEESGEPHGLLVDIVKKLFDKANVPLKLKFLPFKRALQDSKEGKIDGLFNFYKNKDRLKYFDYSKPIIENPLVFFVSKNSKLSYQNLSDLNGLSIGTILGYTYGLSFDNGPHFKREPAHSHISNLHNVIMNRLDAYPCDKLVCIYIARNENILSKLKILPVPLKVMKGHIGFTKGKHNKTIDKINAQIDLMKKSGEIKKTIDNFIKKFN